MSESKDETTASPSSLPVVRPSTFAEDNLDAIEGFGYAIYGYMHELRLLKNASLKIERKLKAGLKNAENQQEYFNEIKKAVRQMAKQTVYLAVDLEDAVDQAP